jgi:hypothetical protein
MTSTRMTTVNPTMTTKDTIDHTNVAIRAIGLLHTADHVWSQAIANIIHFRPVASNRPVT